MEKVFTGNEPIPIHLVERVKNSRLKAELCGECAVLNDRFSNIFRQLEKAKIEAVSCLALIHAKFKTAATLEKDASFNGDSNLEWAAKLEIAEALRKDAMQKCSRKLANVRPLARIQNLTREQINAKKEKIQSVNAATGGQQLDSSYVVDTSEHYDDTGSPGSIPIAGEDVGESYLATSDVVELETEKQEMMEGVSDPNDKNIGIVNVKVEAGYSLERYNIVPSRDTSKYASAQLKNKAQFSHSIPPPLIVGKGAGMDAKPTIFKNSETGKYHCPICSKEYASEGSVQLHYKSAHLKVRYTCEACKREFPQKNNYERHYLIIIHIGAKFKCSECNKMFTHKWILTKHQNNIHSAKK